MNQIELEQEVQRYAGEFVSRVSSAAEALMERPERPELGRAALNRVLLYASSALNIASGPVPEVNLLDMAVFIRLSRSVFETHFVPRVFGEAARPLLDALKMAEQDMWSLASRTLERQELKRLEDLTDLWLQEHPGNTNVELVRFREFAALAGERLEGETSGLFGRVKATVQTADQAVMLAERALFLAQRLPFLLRLHARLAAKDLVADSVQGWKARRVGFRLLGYLSAVGAAWAFSFWGGRYLARRATGPRWRRLLAH